MIVEPLEQVVVGVVGTNSSEYIDAVLAVFARGAVAATLRSVDDAERIEAAGITEIIVPGATTGWLTLTGYPQAGNAKPDAATYAQLAFTSGTEGKPKGILLTHGNLDDVTDRLVAAMSLDSSIREYIGVPVYYSFGFGRVRALGRVGGRGYLPPAGFSPQEIAAMLASGDINALSAVPTLLRLLLQEKSLFTGCGDQLRWLEIGSQYLSQLEKLELKNLFPRATIVQHYGLTEASRTTFLHIHDAPDAALESVGRCHGAAELRLSADRLIQIRGPHVARAQLRDGATQALTDADGWLTTSDLGRLDAGLLYFDGRADEVINCGGVKISPDSLQLQLQRAFGLAGAIAVTRIPDPLRGDSILVAHLRSAAIDPQALRDATERILHGIGINLGNAIAYMPVDSLPMTSTGKLIRKQLAAEYAQQRQAGEAPTTPTAAAAAAAAAADDTLEQRLVAIWEDVLNIRPIARTDSFFDIGGDSLSAIRIIMRMEKLGIPKTVCQQILRGKSIAAIVDATEGEAKLGNIAKVARSIDVTRGLLVLAVVASHWSPGLMEYLPAALGQINRLFAPVYSAGTPGFAIIFGIGAGFFLLHRRHAQPAAVWQNVSKNAKILLFGLLCLAAVRIVALLAQQQPITPVAIANTFWSAITFYLLAAVTLPLWLNLIVRFSNVLFGALLLALASFATHILIDDFIAPAPSTNPLVQLVILSVTAKYNYFEMAMGAFIGIGLGNWLRAGADSKSPPSTPLLQIAALLTAFALIMSHETGETEQWLEWPRPLFLWSWMFYIGAVIGTIGIVHHITTHAADNSRRQVAANLFATLGVMAFPIFIGHEMVLPLRAIFAAAGIPAPLLLALLVFLCPTVYFTVKLYRIYYTSPIVAVRELRGSRYESTT